MMKILKKILRCLHPLNRINISFEFYEKSGGASSGMAGFFASDAVASWNFDLFGEEIRRLVAKGKVAPSARLQVIGLEKIEALFGEKWPRVVDNVHAIVRMTLDKHLEEGDAFAQIKDNAYILMFANANDDEARRRSKKISDEIHDIFLKQERARANAASSAPANDGPGGPLTMKHDAIDESSLSGFSIKHQTLDEASDPSFTIRHEQAEEITLPNVKAATARELETFDLGGDARLPSDMRISFRPLADAQTGVIVSMACVPFSRQGEWYAMLAGSKGSKLFSELDCKALEAFQRECAKKPKMPFVCPVHFNSISDLTNNVFLLQACGKLSADQKQQIIFELFDLPGKLSEAEVKGFVDKLKPYCKAVMIRTDLYGLKKNASALGILSLGVDLRTAGIPEATIAGPMSRFISQAREHKLKTVAFGTDAAGMLESARTAGFSMLGGEAVHAMVEDPAAVGKTSL